MPDPVDYAVLEAWPSAELADAVGEILIRLGAGGVSHEKTDSDGIKLCVYFPRHTSDGLSSLEALQQWYMETTGTLLQTQWVSYQPVNWVAETRKAWAPFLLIPGVWIARHEEDSVPPGTVRLEAGGAFGTGRHASTRLCAQALKVLSANNAVDTVLDIGTGSAILAILAARWGVSSVLGIDNDPDAIPFAQDNVNANGLGSRIRLVVADPRSIRGTFGGVIANLTASLLVALSETLAERCAPGGWLVLGGMLGSEAELVTERMRRLGFSSVSGYHDEGWTALSFRRDAMIF